jgi:hypothetical protein
VNTAGHDRWLVAAGVVLMLVALVVVGRLQGRNLPEGDAAVSQPTTSVEETMQPTSASLWLRPQALPTTAAGPARGRSSALD